MFNFFRKYKNIFSLTLIFIISGLGIFILASNTQAASGLMDWAKNDFAKGLVNLLISLLEMIMHFFGILIAWIVGLLKGIMQFTSPQDAEIVKAGWTVIRDITNMFFILILLIIAFATILRRESYGMKALLPKLIGVALLVNFSLVIMGVIIDFADVTTQMFLQENDEGEVILFQEDIPQALGITKYIDTTAEDPKLIFYECELSHIFGIKTYKVFSSSQACSTAYEGACKCTKLTAYGEEFVGEVLKDMANTDGLLKVALAMFLTLLFMIIAMFVLGSLCIMLLYRIVVLWFLAMISPIVLLLWVLPHTKYLFDKWMNMFFKWTFFAPIATFFIWLSVKTWVAALDPTNPEAGAIPGGAIGSKMSEIAKDEMVTGQVLPNMFLPENLVQFILICGMLVGSLVVAQKMSIHGANGAIALGKKWGLGAAKKMSGFNFAKRKAQRWSAKPAEKAGRGLDKISSWARRSKIGKYSGLSAVLGKGGAGMSKYYEEERNRINEEKKKYESMSPDHLKSLYKTVDRRGKIAIGQILAERGKLKADDSRGFTNQDIKNLSKYSRNYGMEKNILKSRPELAAGLGQSVDEVIKGIKSSEVKNIDENSVEEVQENILKQFQEGGKWTSKHLSELYNNNYGAYKTIENQMNENYTSLRNDIKQFLERQRGAEKQEESDRDIPPRTKGSLLNDIQEYLKEDKPTDAKALGQMLGGLRPEQAAELSQSFSAGYVPPEVSEAMTERFEEGKGWGAEHLRALRQSSPDVYKELEGGLAQRKPNLSKDVKEYLAGNPEKITLDTKL